MSSYNDQDKAAYMRGDDPDGATAQLCRVLSACPPVALAAATAAEAVSAAGRLSVAVAVVTATAETAVLGVENTSVSDDVTVTSPADVAADAAVLSFFLADKSITSGSHNFFT